MREVKLPFAVQFVLSSQISLEIRLGMTAGLKAQPCFLEQGCESQPGTDGFEKIDIGI